MTGTAETDYSPLALTASTRPHIVLVRHGETAWSATGRHTGLTDIPLTGRGEDQARGAGRIIAGYDFGLAVASPLGRSLTTAALAGHPEATPLADLVEWDYGGYEGLTTPEIRARTGDDWTVWQGVPAGATPGEDLEAVRIRAARALERVRPVLDSGRDVLVFSHSHFLRVFASVWLRRPDAGERLFLGTGSVSALGTEHGSPVVAAWNIAPMG